MIAVFGCWTLAMISGLCWTRLYTGILTAATVIAGLFTRDVWAGGWLGGIQLAAFAATPWLPAAQQEQTDAQRKDLHKQEAAEMAHLSSATRSLLSL